MGGNRGTLRPVPQGRPVYVEGRLSNRQWQDREGHKRNATDVVATRVVFLSSRHPDAVAAPPGRPANGDDDGLDDRDVTAVKEDAAVGHPQRALAVG